MVVFSCHSYSFSILVLRSLVYQHVFKLSEQPPLRLDLLGEGLGISRVVVPSLGLTVLGSSLDHSLKNLVHVMDLVVVDGDGRRQIGCLGVICFL